MNQSFRPLACFVTTWVMLAGLSGDASALTRHQHVRHAKKADSAAGTRHQRKAALKRDKHAVQAAPARREPALSDNVPPPSEAASQLTGDPAAVKKAIDLVRAAKTGEATAVERTIDDPAGQKLVEWYILRHSESAANFSRFAAFLADNPAWPSMRLLRRRAEARLWQERGDAATVRAFTGDRPTSAKGHLALGRALLAENDRDGAGREVRQVWRSEELSERTEGEAIEMFHDLLTSEDYRARMDKRIGARDFSGAMRAAHHLGSDELSIVKACAAVAAGSTKALDRLDDVASEARHDLGYALCRIQWLMRSDRIADAARLMLASPSEAMALQDTDEWWRVRRVLARKLLDMGMFQTAYQVASGAALPANENYRAEFPFLSGWIALRYLHDPVAARAHFARVDDGSVNPIVLARANYWRGRAAEAAGDSEGMRVNYEAAARHPTAYYGQLARAKLGLDKYELRPVQAGPADGAAPSEEFVRAVEILYAVGARDIVLTFVTDLSEQCTDVATLTALAELTGRRDDARAMLEIGKTALGRGMALDAYAFPTIGIPQHSPIGPAIERSIIYSVARTESAFDQRDRSAAQAVGLMQVTPEAGRDTAKRFGVAYDWDRMVSDPVYNTQMGAAELAALLQEYKGSQIMTFAGYNAGRGRVQDWMKQYGDPRDPDVDPIDWVERIPFAETRNYVQRVMENLQVYRVQFDRAAQAISKLDRRHGVAQEVSATPPAPTQASHSD